MGKHLHLLFDKDFATKTAVCAVDGPVNIVVYGNTYRCEVAYRQHQNRMRSDRKGTPRDVKGDTCEGCGFVAAHPCQLDLDHINGDRRDHRLENLQTLCANCHRLKSYHPELYRSKPMVNSPAGST